jgi:acyl-CoA thioester hydrolase
MYRPFETYRGFVYPWSMDHVGHMNVQFYTARFDEATWHFLARLGLTPRYLREQGRAAVAVDQRTQYRREVVAGTLLHVETELLEVGRKSVRFRHRMYDSETHEEVASTELVGVYFDTERRTSDELPPRVHAHARALLRDEVDATPLGER